jgi:hypothetical protein
MNEIDKTPIIGAAGTLFSISIGQLNEWFGLAAGVLTCVYLVCRIYKLFTDRKK